MCQLDNVFHFSAQFNDIQGMVKRENATPVMLRLKSIKFSNWTQAITTTATAAAITKNYCTHYSFGTYNFFPSVFCVLDGRSVRCNARTKSQLPVALFAARYLLTLNDFICLSICVYVFKPKRPDTRNSPNAEISKIGSNLTTDTDFDMCNHASTCIN